MPSSQIKIAGKGFAANSQVEIMLDETGLARTETDSNGQFALEASIPKDTDLGMHKVWAKDAVGNFARAVIMVGEIERPDNIKPIDRQLVVKAGIEHYNESAVVIIGGYGIPESIVELEVKDPTGKVVLHERTSTDMKGMFGVKMQLSTDAQNGTYIVYAKQEGQETKSAFTVMLREKPPTTIESVLTVNTEHEKYQDHDNVVIFGRAGPGTVGIAVMHGDTTNIASNMVFKDEVKVSEDGSFKTVFAVNDVKEGIYVVMAHQGSLTASAKFFVESSERGEHSDERHDDHEDEHDNENNESMNELKVHTDKDSYGIGEAVTIYGGNANPEKRIEILIFHAETKNDRTVYKDVLTPNSDGSFKKTSPPITSDVEPGVYTVVVMQGDSGAETRFKIVT
jgi:hypothetical protein